MRGPQTKLAANPYEIDAGGGKGGFRELAEAVGCASSGGGMRMPPLFTRPTCGPRAATARGSFPRRLSS